MAGGTAVYDHCDDAVNCTTADDDCPCTCPLCPGLALDALGEQLPPSVYEELDATKLRLVAAEERLAAVRSITDYWDAMPKGDGNLLFRSKAIERIREALSGEPGPLAANDYDECTCQHADDQHNVWTGEPWVFRCNFNGCACRIKVEAKA